METFIDFLEELGLGDLFGIDDDGWIPMDDD